MISQNTVKYGVIAGVIGIVNSILVYILGPEFLSSLLNFMVIGLLTLVITIVTISVFSTKIRKDEGGFISFKSMFINIMLLVIIMVAISGAFSLLLNNVIDPGFMETAKEMALENVVAKENEMSEAQFEGMITTINEMYSNGIGDSLKQMLSGILGLGIFSLILAAILKKKQEDFV